eukprot:jgi/Picsp_1/6552/NSC_03895-R1_protein
MWRLSSLRQLRGCLSWQNAPGPNSLETAFKQLSICDANRIDKRFIESDVQIANVANDKTPTKTRYIALNTLRDNPGATQQRRRVGRGIGSSKGKTAGRGHKGQKARSGGGPKVGFEGGQTPMRLRVPKKGFRNRFSRTYDPLGLDRLAEWIEQNRLDPSRVITMKALRDSGAVRRKIRDGVKLLAPSNEFKWKVVVEVSQSSKAAREAIEKAGGKVTTVYYNKLGLRAHLLPDWFEKKGRLLPRPAKPPPKLADKFDQVGNTVTA